MAESKNDTFAHVIANIDTTAGEGRIRYVLPAKMRTSSAEQAGIDSADEGVRLVLKDASGKEIARVRPELRFEACHDDEKPHRAIIQQDIAVTGALSEIDLELNGKTLDVFRPEAIADVGHEFQENATFGLPLPGKPGKLALGTSKVTQRGGTSYMVQAKPSNANQWQTLVVGHPTPDFVFDKNQFSGASSVEVKITQNAGFQSRIVDQRTISLEAVHGVSAGAELPHEAAAHVRRNVWELGGDWPDALLWYARAVAVLGPKAISDRTSWRFWAGMHGYHQGLWEFYGLKTASEPIPAKSDLEQFWLQCQHGSWYFLPWHRGYLIAFEKLIRSTVVGLGGPTDWTLPYWNYFKKDQSELPQAFATPDWPDGTGTNPLFVEQRWGPDPDQPGKVFIPPNVIDLDAMNVAEFTGVGSGGDPGFGGIDTGFEHGGMTHGDLESDPHDQVHGLIGGEKMFPEVSPRPLPGLMSAPQTAGLDPIFWLHHANIDRLWQSWRLKDPKHADPTEPRWIKGPANFGQRAFVVPLPDGTPWEFTPGQMSDFASQDYTYDDFTPGADAMTAGMEPAKPKVRNMSSGSGKSKKTTVELVGASDLAVPVVGKSTDAVIPLDAGMRKKVAGNLTAGASPSAVEEKVLLNVENVTGYSDATVLQVFVQFPGISGKPPIERKVGSIGLFGVTKATEKDEGHGDGLSYVLNITRSYAEFAGKADLEKLGVRFEAVGSVQEAAELKIGRISIVRQGK